MKVLVTGFEPFDKEKINPAWEAVKLLPEELNGCKIIKLELPTVFKKSSEKLIEKIQSVEPNVVICVGQAGGRYDFCLERVGINIDDGRIPDNAGYQPQDEPIAANGPVAYFSTLPIKEIVKNLKENLIPSIVSNTAGTYVCNHIMYSLLHYISQNNLDIKGGFIHVPYIPEQVLDKKNMPYMELSTIVKALEISIKTVIKNN